MNTTTLTELLPGTPIIFAGDRVTTVPEELAEAFVAGDALVVLQSTGDLLHIPAADRRAATDAVDAAHTAFASMGEVADEAVDAFYAAFAARLADEQTFAPIAAANAADVERARERGRSVTRLTLTDRMRRDMIDGLRSWAATPSPRGRVERRIDHDGWHLEEFRDRLGVVAFVFEGRPNVFADACGVLRGGNTVVFRIGSDALQTARAIVEHALDPALAEAGLPAGAASLVDAPSHAAGWALFGDPRLALAVARGSGSAVDQLGTVARQAGNPVSLHGTGGAWMVAATSADPYAFGRAVRHSLDRKVCNTLNTCCIVRERAAELVPVFLDALEEAARSRGVEPKLHVVTGTGAEIPASWHETVDIHRADGVAREPRAEPLAADDLGTEWEWEDSPEVSLVVVDDVDEACRLFNAHSPHFILSLASRDEQERERVEAAVHAPFVGDGFTRWVDGQYALGTPELGLSNWEAGRLMGRSGILSGEGIHTVRTRARQHDPDVHR